MQKFVIGDIHGELEKLKGVLTQANFDYENDLLISLGDVVDRGKNSYLVVEELLKIKNLVSVRGNHDDEWLTYLQTSQSALWSQGASATYFSYENALVKPSVHLPFFENQLPYHIDQDNNLFIHGGFDRHKLLKNQDEFIFYWDRDLFLAALSYQGMKQNKHSFKIKQNFNKIYVGHTPTTYWGKTTPIEAANIVNIDTGSGKGGLLTLLNLQTNQIYQQ
jgi:serine/threonine protein phosphatase 1